MVYRDGKLDVFILVYWKYVSIRLTYTWNCVRDGRYKGVKIENFSTSWRSGLGFNALIHAHRPDLVNYDALNPADHVGNLNNAFNVAKDKLGIARLLDAEGCHFIYLALMFDNFLFLLPVSVSACYCGARIS